MFGLEPLELVEQPIELFIRDLGRVVNVVPLLVVADGAAELVQPLLRVGRHVRAGLSKRLRYERWRHRLAATEGEPRSTVP
jgi:hypothetical protein